MTTTAVTPTTTTATPTTTATINDNTAHDTPARRTVWKAGLVAGLAAAAVTTIIAVTARAADVPLAVKGEQIPIFGFAQFTVVGALLGIGLAKLLAKRTSIHRRAFIRATVALTALSIVPDVVVDATVATKLVLAFTHVVAATMIVPALAARLAD